MNPFDELSDEFKEHLIGLNGIFIGSIEYYNSIIKLYYLQGLYVEVQLNRDQNDIERIGLVKEKALDKYINQVQLPDFF